MTPDPRIEDKPSAGQAAEVPSAEDRRVQARRRFLRTGAGGTAALIVTVTHKRAFAGIKKNTVASNCASLRGVPDLKGADQKKALETSAMGTPKGLVCRPKGEPPSCPTAGDKLAKYVDSSGVPQYYISASVFKNGCGSIERTVQASRNYRLYQKGWCPLKYDANGISYDTTAAYFKQKKGGLESVMCKVSSK